MSTTKRDDNKHKMQTSCNQDLFAHKLFQIPHSVHSMQEDQEIWWHEVTLGVLLTPLLLNNCYLSV